MLYDISPPITPELAVWPGDTPLTREVLLDIARGDNVTLSTARTTVHLGAHADGPNHYGKNAPAIHERSLEYYVGLCEVVRVNVPASTRIPVSSAVKSLAQSNRLAQRILFATGTYPNPNNWNTDFAALSIDLVNYLHDCGVITIGIDTPSVDLFESKDLPAHRAMLEHNMAILEGLVLDQVPNGTYELIALPLPLVGFDASPVRAVLRTRDRNTLAPEAIYTTRETARSGD